MRKRISNSEIRREKKKDRSETAFQRRKKKEGVNIGWGGKSSHRKHAITKAGGEVKKFRQDQGESELAT